MNFTYETQGVITYLVCELTPDEQIDSLTLGMLTNNHIPGLAPVLYTEMNGQRYLKYNISAKVSADQFFSGSINKQRALNAFQNILNAICSADEYMIDQNCFSIASERIFLNVSSCEVSLLCIPVLSDKDINFEVATFFKKIMFSTQFDNSEDVSYITQLITYINNSASFSVYGLKDLVYKLQTDTRVNAYTSDNGISAQSSDGGFSAQQSAQTSISSFDSTISIDQMPDMMAGKQTQEQTQATVQNTQMNSPVAPPVRPAPSRMSYPQTTAPTFARPINNEIPAQYNKPAQETVKPQTPITQKPIAQSNPGFAIPGQPSAGTVKPQTHPSSAKKQEVKSEPAGEKKMTLFSLLAHYNKENAELYKKQKEEAKAKKTATSSKTVQPPTQPSIPKDIGRYNTVQTPQMNNQRQQFTPVQYTPRVQPVPVQNSFNETTVLTPAMTGGDTTVLNVNSGIPNPYLTRVKTGERISINKPVFRIGKEKSYVDYFIADNTAISRSHANIHTENGEFFIEDTNSTNHTYLNGKLIDSNIKNKLNNGDKVRLANEDFIFSV